MTGEDAAVVVLGSAGRFEVTTGSDTDWTCLVDGQAKPKHQETAMAAGRAISEVGGKQPVQHSHSIP